MRVLLDTNILIYREGSNPARTEIGPLFYWLDKLSHTKCVHPASLEEIAKHGDPVVRAAFAVKLPAYHILRTVAPTTTLPLKVTSSDKTRNDEIDSLMLAELLADRVDLLITEDRGIHRKAAGLDRLDRVFTIDGFLEKITAENPTLIDYRTLAIRKDLFGNINLRDGFFDSFRSDYGTEAFDRWFARKSDEEAYVCTQGSTIVGFLYLKVEGQAENYVDVIPPFRPLRRLKVGSFKVVLNGLKIGERFLRIIFDNALRQAVDETYVTIVNNSPEKDRLIKLLLDFGFEAHGHKSNHVVEQVLVRNTSPSSFAGRLRNRYPYISTQSPTYLVPIYPRYHTDLFPDSILRTESPRDFLENAPHRNAIRKIYISRSINKGLLPGDYIIFYRTGGLHQSVVTTVGMVERTHLNLSVFDEFVSLCRKRSVFTDLELKKFWDFKPNNRPFIVEFLYCYSFPKRPNLKSLIDEGVIRDVESAPRGFERISKEQAATIYRLSKTETRIIIN